MSEIKQSQKGVAYANPCKLKEKQRVYSQAMLMKIPHDHQDTTDISLKIGRYNYPFGEATSATPKSELTLDNDELNALIKYISENYTPVNLGSGEYINVDRSDAELIQQFKRIITNQRDAANMLIENDILADNVLLAATAIKKRKALSEYETELSNNLPEKFWQDWFAKNKWVLGSDFAQIIDERSIDTENIADYIMRAFDGFIDLVEIKKPYGLPFWSTAKDHGNFVPSSDLVKAITQCLNYIYEIERESNSQKFIERAKSKVVKPRCILVFGRSNDWNDEQRESYRILNSAYNQISILTYDQLLERAKNVLETVDYQGEKETTDELPF